MAIIASKFYPITDIFFKHNKEIKLRPGDGILSHNEPYVVGIHIFNWGAESWLTVETESGQVIKFPATSLVEGAVYYMRLSKLINAGPNRTETQVMGISTSVTP